MNRFIVRKPEMFSCNVLDKLYMNRKHLHASFVSGFATQALITNIFPLKFEHWKILMNAIFFAKCSFKLRKKEDFYNVAK